MDPKFFSQILDIAGKVLPKAPGAGGANGQSLDLGQLIPGLSGDKSEALSYAISVVFLEPKAFEAALQKLHKEVFTHPDITAKLGSTNRELTLEKLKSEFIVKNSNDASITVKHESPLGILLNKEYLMTIIQSIKTKALSGGEASAYQKLLASETYEIADTWTITLDA